jgi:putative ABC transport system permease protein
MGLNLESPAVRLPEVLHGLKALRPDEAVFFDRRTRPDYGPRETGTLTELDGHRIHVVGHYDMGAGLAAYGTLIVSDQNFSRLSDGLTLDQVNLGLVRLKPDADLERSAQVLREALPSDVRVLTRREIEKGEKEYWVSLTSTGLIFGLGTVVACLVGVVIVYQVLSSDLTRHLREYATLKAIGYTDRHLTVLVLQKVLALAVVAYAPALVAVLGLYAAARRVTFLPIYMNPGRAVVVLGLTIGIGAVAASLSLRKLRVADPADLF